MASHATFFPESSALPMPPAIDICAPRSGPRGGFLVVINDLNVLNGLTASTRAQHAAPVHVSPLPRLVFEMSSFHQRQGNTAGAEKLVMKFAEIKFISQSVFFLTAPAIDDRPAEGVSHRHCGGLPVPVQIAASLRAREVELAHHEIRRLLVSHSTGLCFDIDNNSQGAPKSVLEH